MAISFRCPNGHKLTCPDQRAGQAGKCPKCGAAFHVPTPDSKQAEEQLVGAAVSEEIATGGSGVRIASGAGGFSAGGTAADAAHHDTIVFLCPNGHKLNAPVRLQGKPGKCPHCGEKFLVPMIEEGADFTGAGSFFDLPGEPATIETPSVQEEKPVTAPSDSGFTFSAFAPEDEFTAGLIESGPQAMANLFTRLWGQRGETGVVELYLKGGEILSPHWYAPQLSQHAYGMFAFQEQDGSHTLTAVHWAAIERIALRGLPQLPEGVFES